LSPLAPGPSFRGSSDYPPSPLFAPHFFFSPFAKSFSPSPYSSFSTCERFCESLESEMFPPFWPGPVDFFFRFVSTRRHTPLGVPPFFYVGLRCSQLLPSLPPPRMPRFLCLGPIVPVSVSPTPPPIPERPFYRKQCFLFLSFPVLSPTDSLRSCLSRLLSVAHTVETKL